jgi:hypothetical protein
MHSGRFKMSLFALFIITIVFFTTCRSTIKPLEEKKQESVATIRPLPAEELQKDRRLIPDCAGYRLHEQIRATCFYIGEYKAGPVLVLDNRASAWTGRWVDAFGDIDRPEKREGFFPEGFVPDENPFYCALPYNDLAANGYKDDFEKVIPWVADGAADEERDWPYSYCKNRWIRVEYGDRVCYAQWEDVGPFETDDDGYVYGEAPPKNRYNDGAGLDLSPACFTCLGISGSGLVNWRFITFEEVPDGPWKAIITTSEPNWK